MVAYVMDPSKIEPSLILKNYASIASDPQSTWTKAKKKGLSSPDHSSLPPLSKVR